jgi:hypothetical protein
MSFFSLVQDPESCFLELTKLDAKFFLEPGILGAHCDPLHLQDVMSILSQERGSTVQDSDFVAT